jgi:glutamyl-tRNA reductase
VVTAERHRRFLSEKGVLMIDLGMPRNLDPELGGGNVRLADLDLLKQWHRSMNGSLGQARKICQQVLEEHRPIYERMRSGMRPED